MLARCCVVLLLSALVAAARADLTMVTGHQDPSSVASGSGIRLTGGQSNGSVSIKAVLPVQDGNPTIQQQLSVSSPLSKSSDTTTQPATLDGLANSTAGQYSLVFAKPWDKDNPHGLLYMFGAAGKLGYQEFTYYDKTTLAKSTSNKNPGSLSLYGALLPGNTTAVFFKFEYQAKYADAKTKVSCPAGAGAGTVVCVNGPIGAPEHSTARIFSLEMRYALPKVNFAPVLSYDNVSGAKGLDVPIYLIQADDKSGALNGGIDIGYRSDTHGSIGIFVGKAFSFFGQ